MGSHSTPANMGSHSTPANMGSHSTPAKSYCQLVKGPAFIERFFYLSGTRRALHFDLSFTHPPTHPPTHNHGQPIRSNLVLSSRNASHLPLNGHGGDVLQHDVLGLSGKGKTQNTTKTPTHTHKHTQNTRTHTQTRVHAHTRTRKRKSRIFMRAFQVVLWVFFPARVFGCGRERAGERSRGRGRKVESCVARNTRK